MWSYIIKLKNTKKNLSVKKSIANIPKVEMTYQKLYCISFYYIHRFQVIHMLVLWPLAPNRW